MDQKKCACGCGALMLGRRSTAKFFDERHKQRAFRRAERERQQAVTEGFWGRLYGVRRKVLALPRPAT